MKTQHGWSNGARAVIGAVAATLLSAVVVVGGPSFTEDAGAASAKVTICHRTHSTTNPYRRITVSQSSITRNHGHGDHEAASGSPAVFDPTYAYPSNGKSWGDIVPGGDSAGAPFNGANNIALNWTTAGKATFGSAACGRLTAMEFFEVEVAAGVPIPDILADLNSQGANEDVALLAALGGQFTTENLESWETAVSVVTNDATAVTIDSATIHGTLTVGSTSTVPGFEWGTSPTLAGAAVVAAAPTPVTGSAQAVAAGLTGLSPATTYFYRATGTTNIGTDAEGVLLGEILSFATPGTEPESTDPEVTDPETTDPEVTDPEVTDPEVTDPEVTDPEVTDPEVTDPEVTDPEVTDPETTDPETTDPETTDPDVAGPPAPPSTESTGVGAVRGVVWFDRNGNGAIDPREWLLPGVSVRLTSVVGAVSAAAPSAAARPDVDQSTTTAADGSYSFTNLPVGAYAVTASAVIDGFDRTSDTDGALDWVVAVEVLAGATDVADFAGLGRGRILGSVFEAATNQPLGFATVTCRWSGFDDVAGTADDVAFDVKASSDGTFDIAGVPYGEFSCSGIDIDGRPSSSVAAAVHSAVPVLAPLPVATEVGGARRARGPVATADATLPRTGTDVTSPLLVGFSWIGTGFVLVRLAPRRRAAWPAG
jgi:hypothetical protein